MVQTKQPPKPKTDAKSTRVHPLKTFMRTELERRFQPLDGGVIVSYRGLNSEKMYDLRAKLHKQGAKFQVVKNAVAVRAFGSLGYDETKLGKLFEGPVGVVYPKAGTGVVGAVKALNNWRTETKDKIVEVKGGFLDGAIISPADVKALQNMPSREQLLGMVAGAFQAPMSAFANRLHECMAKFAYAVNAVKEKKEKETK